MPTSKTSTDTQTSSNGTGTASASTNPWAVQSRYLTNAFQGASSALGTAQNNAVIPSQFTANYTPDQIAAFQAQQNYGMNTGTAANSAAAGGAMNAAGVSGVQNGLGGLAGFQNQGGTDSNIAAAMKYAGNQPISAMTDAAMRDATNQANEVTKPGIDEAAAGSGNVNSSRTAIQQGIVDRGLAQKAGDISANLRGAAYNSGLTLAQQNSQYGNTNNLTALMAQLSGGTSAVNAGTAANSGSVTQAGGLFNIANAGIAGQYGAAQAPLTNAQQSFTANSTDPFTALQQYYGLVGANNWGGSTSGATTNNTNGTNNTQGTATPSTVSQIGGYMGMAGSLLSDERTKTEITQVGSLNDGQKVYRYRYRGFSTWHIGLIAQEVEKLYAHAVTEIHGLKHVNYDLATRHC